MKVLFTNPPVIRFGTDSPEHDPKIDSSLLKIKLISRKIPFLYSLLDKAGISKGVRFGVRAGSRWPWTAGYPISAIHYPFFMGYAASYLEREGFDVNIIDAVAEEEYSYQRFLDNVKNENADIVVIECSTPTIDIDLWMAREISKFTRVALAGPHLTINAENIRDAHPYIDFFLKGEYILSSLKMARTLMPGIYESEVVTNLDSIPFPFRDYSSAIKYYDPTMPTERPQLQIYGSKGCPFKCTFCMWPQTMYQGKVALRDPEKIAREIQYCINSYNFKSIFFDDDTFNIGNDRISKLCDELKNIGLPWTMMGRLDCSPDWLFDKIVESGCVGMRFGIETFNLEILKGIQKGIERVDFKKTLEYLSTSYPDVYIHVTMMKNLPGQTDEIHQLDMNILHEMGFSTDNIYRSYQLAMCAPFPGTKMYYDLLDVEGTLMLDYNRYDGGQNTIMTEVNK